MNAPQPSAGRPDLTAAKKALLEKRLRGQAAGAPRADVVTPRARRDFLPLSFSQQRLWFLEQLQPGLGFNHIHAAIRVRGDLDVPALRRTLTEILRRHESLRTNFTVVDGAPAQTVAAPFEFALPETDLRHVPAAEVNAEVHRRAMEEANLPFDLERDPLFRGQLLVLGPGDHALFLTMHHVISDGWSIGVMIQELATLYEAFREGRPSPLPELALQYPDYAAWQREYLSGAVLERQLGFWSETLRNAPALELRTDRPRPAVQTFRGESLWFTVPAAQTGALHELANRMGATLFMVGLAAFQALLARWSGQEDVVVGSPIANRTRREIEPLVGFFVNTLVLRGDLSGDPTFRELVARTREAALGAYAHQDLPFEKLVDEVQPERDLSRNPLFQVMFALQNAPGSELELPGLRLAWEPPKSGTSKFDVMLWAQERGGELDACFEYNTDLFDAPTIHRMERHYRRVLDAVIADPDVRLSDLPLMDDEERELLAAWNETAETFDAAGETLHGLVEAQARRTPDAPAVAFEGRTLTYAELDARADALAASLRGRGVGPETRVGVCMERSAELVVALLGVLKAGAAYVPLDPSYPAERLAYMAADAALPVLLMQEELRGRVPGFAGEVVVVGADAGAADALSHSRTPALSHSPSADSLAYVIYTSGSTGQPKGAMNAHRGIVNRLLWMQREYGLAADDVVLQKTPFSFDVSVWEFFWPLVAGAKLVLARPEGHRDPHYLSELIEEQGVTTLHFVPSMLQAFLDAGEPWRCGSVRRVVCSGEALGAEVRDRFFERLPHAELHNLYGPTEAAVDVTFHACERGRPTVPIGRPVANTRIHVLDGGLRQSPVGVPGELYIGGVQVGRGYHGRPGLTAERFVPDPFAAEPGARMYRTGDRARWLATGEVEYLGRLDEQVKVRGHRIELGEIESALLRQPGVREAVAAAREDAPGHARLVAYVVADEAAGATPAGLRLRLKEELPEYMVPAAVVLLDALPVTPNGKLDRAALPAPEWTRAEEGPTVAPRDEVEATLAGIWCGVLRLDRVGVHDNFFELGGDSILSIQVISRAAQAGIRITPRQVFQHPTVAELAAVADTAAAVQAEQGEVTGEAPLTPVQRWLLELPLPEPHHWNQALLLEVVRPLEPAVLRRAVAALLRHHDALRLRFARGADGEWRQECAPMGAEVPFEHVDQSAVPAAEREAETERTAARAQASLELERGPLLRAVYFGRGGEPGRLLLVVHHLAVDGVSWGVLVEDLERACAQLARGEPARFPAKTTSFRQWAERLAEHARTPAAEAEMEHWLAAAAAPAARLPTDFPGGDNTEAHARVARVELTEEETHALVHEVPAAYRTQVADVLLAAYARAVGAWTGERAVRVELEGHGREPLFEDVDLSRTVGWFTSVFPVALDAGDGPSPGDALKAVKEQLRAVPGKGIGYGLLRYLGRDEVRGALAALPPAEASFNYLGQLDALLPGAALFRPVDEPMGAAHAASSARRYLLEVNAGIQGGRLHAGWTYSERVHRPETVRALAESWLASLRELIAHCRAPEEAVYTPSDFPEAELSQDELDDLIADFISLNEQA
ncbi:MAG: amino acid adenylation domain-containing protein [Gemmatimonadota bacterium]